MYLLREVNHTEKLCTPKPPLSQKIPQLQENRQKSL